MLKKNSLKHILAEQKWCRTHKRSTFSSWDSASAVLAQKKLNLFEEKIELPGLWSEWDRAQPLDLMMLMLWIVWHGATHWNTFETPQIFGQWVKSSNTFLCTTECNEVQPHCITSSTSKTKWSCSHVPRREEPHGEICTLIQSCYKLAARIGLNRGCTAFTEDDDKHPHACLAFHPRRESRTKNLTMTNFWIFLPVQLFVYGIWGIWGVWGLLRHILTHSRHHNYAVSTR